MTNKKKFIAGLTLAGALTISSLVYAVEKNEDTRKRNRTATKVIMMVMDGTNSDVVTLSRWYKGKSLALDEIMTGGVRTYSAGSAITDSAAAATALATGHKSNDNYIGILPSIIHSPGLKALPHEQPFHPLANVLEGAKHHGKATGIIATAAIQHATPAGFTAHVTHRGQYDDIAEQQVYQNIDVVLGGGKESLIPGLSKYARKDGENLLQVLKTKNYEIVENRHDLLTSHANKIWGSFAPAAFAYDLDRKTLAPNEPTLAEMTNKAIQILNKDEDGFFLLVEGSKIDWAAHANDPIGMISDILAFDDAVREAVEFAKKDGNTMVVAVTDHGNSGLTIGNVNTNSTYSNTPVSTYIEPLKKAKMTVEGALMQLNPDHSNLIQVAGLYGLTNLSPLELSILTSSHHLSTDLTKLLARRANIGFTTNGHTGEDVSLYSFGPSRPIGLIENTDIPKKMAQFMGFRLEKLTNELYLNAEQAFKKKGFETNIEVTNPENPLFIAKNENITIEIPVNKNLVILHTKDGQTIHEVQSINIFNGNNFYVSEQVFHLIK